jgi:hypothetical protein
MRRATYSKVLGKGWIGSILTRKVLADKRREGEDLPNRKRHNIPSLTQ